MGYWSGEVLDEQRSWTLMRAALADDPEMSVAWDRDVCPFLDATEGFEVFNSNGIKSDVSDFAPRVWWIDSYGFVNAALYHEASRRWCVVLNLCKKGEPYGNNLWRAGQQAKAILKSHQ